MTLSPDDLAAMKALHVRGRGATGEVGDDPTLFREEVKQQTANEPST
jgi:hypothetical protein